MPDGSFLPNDGQACEDAYPDHDFCNSACLAYVGCINCPTPEDPENIKDCGVESDFSASAPRRPNPRPGPLGAPLGLRSPLPTPRLPQS